MALSWDWASITRYEIIFVNWCHTGFFKSSSFLQVPFMEVLELVRTRRVYLEKGFAYVPQEDLIVVILSLFREHLSHGLAVSLCFWSTTIYLALAKTDSECSVLYRSCPEQFPIWKRMNVCWNSWGTFTACIWAMTMLPTRPRKALSQLTWSMR